MQDSFQTRNEPEQNLLAAQEGRLHGPGAGNGSTAKKQLTDLSKPLPVVRTFWQDSLFYVAVLAGPLFWLILYFIQQPSIRWDWPFIEPWQFLLPVLIIPVLEEMVFRGLVQDLVQEHIRTRLPGPISIANLLTSVLFTGLHFIYNPPLWAALVFLPSLVFGFFKDRTRQLAAPIFLHCFYNAGFIWLFTLPL